VADAAGTGLAPAAGAATGGTTGSATGGTTGAATGGAHGGGERPATGTNAAWFERAQQVIPGGVDSPVRSFQSVGGIPFTVGHGEGPWVFDVEGRRYLDFVQSYGAVLLGHAHPVVVEAVCRAASLGSSFGMPTPGEVLLAEAICARVPGCEQVRFVSSGTEAAMSALRLARGVTGRSRVVKFDGCYHGHSDGLLAGGGSGVATLGLPGSVGVPLGAVADTLVVPYNVVPELDEQVACVIVEPVAANMNLVAPRPGFLEGLRRACDAAGALLVFDEVISGFRIGPATASVLTGVTPDLWCFGKVVGGGLPIGAFGGRRELMAALAPSGPVYQAGTLSGNPLATAAGLAVLGEVTPADYDALASRVARFAGALADAVRAGGLSATAPVAGTLAGLFVGPPPGAPLDPPADFDGARAIASSGVYPPFFHALLRRGVMLAPGAYEVVFCGLAHGDAELDLAVEAAGEAAAEVARALG
jgi:glutamate-1-semialdehyde 2,1-aminomutase